MKVILVAALLALATLPTVAKEDFCYSPAMITADVEKVPTAEELMKLYSIDIGFSELVDVTIWGDGDGHYLAAAFVAGCYVGNQIMDDTTVEEFIDEHTKRAEPRL